MGAIPFHHYPLAPDDTSWDGPKEVSAASVDDLKVMCAWVEDGNEDKKGAYKLPHHLSSSHKTVKAAVIAAGNALMGARGGVHGIPKDEIEAVKAHLEKHYHEFKLTAPWEAKGDNRLYQTMESKALVTDIDTIKGVVSGYFAAFGNVDSDGDVFMPGCFDKTISENKDRIMHLLQHNTFQPLGRPELSVDDKGLSFITTISKTQYGIDTLRLYVDKVYNEHSVGFEMINCAPITIAGESANGITEVKLWEGSTVTWGANANTPTESVKRLPLEERISHIKNRSSILRKALHRGELHDNTYTLLELELKQWESYLALQPPASTVADTGELLEKMLQKTINLKYTF